MKMMTVALFSTDAMGISCLQQLLRVGRPLVVMLFEKGKEGFLFPPLCRKV